MPASWQEDLGVAGDVCMDTHTNQLPTYTYDPLHDWRRLALGCCRTRLDGDWKSGSDCQDGRQGGGCLAHPGPLSLRRAGCEAGRLGWFTVKWRALQNRGVLQAGETVPTSPVSKQGSATSDGFADERRPRRVEDRASTFKGPIRYERVVRKGLLGMTKALLCAMVVTANPGHDELGVFLPAHLAGWGIPLRTLGTSALDPAQGRGWVPYVPRLPDTRVGGSAQNGLGIHGTLAAESATPTDFLDHGIRLIPTDPFRFIAPIERIGRGGREVVPEGSRPDTPDKLTIGHDYVSPRFTVESRPVEPLGELAANPDGSAGPQVGPISGERPAGRHFVQVVDLGTSGSITLRQEGGVWMSNEGPVQDGFSITAANGSLYTLRYRYGYWSADWVPEVRRIVGTGLRATWLEDRSGYRVGTTALLSKEGRGDVSADGAMYRVWEENGSLWGARFDAPPHGAQPADGHYSIDLGRQIATLMEDDKETPANEEGTRIRVGGGDFAVEELVGKGSSKSFGETIVPAVLAEILDLRETAQALLTSLGDDSSSLDYLDSELARLWQGVLSNIRRIFTGSVERWKVLSDARKAIERRQNIVEQFDVVVSALSNLEAFQAATDEHGEGVFAEAKIGASNAANLYRARISRSEAILAVTGDTRHGAVRTEVRRGGRAERGFALAGRGAGAGVFAYSTIPDTERISHISLSGESTYRGRTAAVDGEGRFYTGNIELAVRFVDEKVWGLITGLSDERGRPWVYELRKVDAIFLPGARLQYDADWAARASRSNSALVKFEDKFARQHAVSRASFAGHLLGTGARAGHQSVGSWSIGVQSDGTEYLAGAFGAVVAEDPQEDGPSGSSIAENTTPETMVLPVGSDIGDGFLALAGTLYVPNPETTLTPEDWDDEMLLLDNGRKVLDVYKVPLEEAFARNGAERSYLGRNLVDLAFEEIANLRKDLLAVVDLGDGGVALGERSRIWSEINERVRDRLFGTADKALLGKDFANDEAVPAGAPRKWSSGYPTTGDGGPDDTSALRAIDTVLAALRNPRALVGAVAENEGGVFTRSDGSPFRPLASGQIDEIWYRADGRIQLWTESTDYTRFGAWRKQTAPNAWSRYRDRTENDENGPNAFAYSPIPPTNYRDYRFPLGGTSKYSGKTVAVQGQSFYTGTVELSVRWHEPQRGQYDAGILTGVISSLETGQGDALRYVGPVAGDGTEQSIGEIYFDGIQIGIDSQYRLYFSDALPEVRVIESGRIGAIPVNLSGDPSVTASLTGKFVGRTPVGPQGAIGTWTLRSNGSHRIGTGDTIHGGFGAEIDP